MGHAGAGRPSEGVAKLRKAFATVGEHNQLWLARTLIWLGEAQVETGAMIEARASADEALARAQARGERFDEAYALRLQGGIAVSSGNPDRAEEKYREALGIATELGMRPLVAHCHRGFAKLYQGTPKREEAQAHLSTAMAMYREMRMTYWLENAQRQIENLESDG